MADCDSELNYQTFNLITITVRSAKDRRDIVIDDNKTVFEFKKLIAQELSASTEQLCLINAGTSLKDSCTIRECSLVDGSTVHLVIKSLSSVRDEDSQPFKKLKVNVKESPFGLSDIGGVEGLIDLGFGSANFVNLQQKLQKEMYSNPELIKSLLENEVVSEVVSQPDLIKNMMANNACLNEIIQSNPKAFELMNHPELMKQMNELVKMPAILQEVVDPKYRSVVGLKTTEELRSESEAQMKDEQTTLPIRSSSAVEDESCDTKSRQQPSLGTATECLLKQFINNSAGVADVLESSYVQSTINYMANDPQLLRQMLHHSPGVKNSDEVKIAIDQSLPYIAQQLLNPEVYSLMINPRALQAILEIQDGMKELERCSPGFFLNMSEGQTSSSYLTGMLKSVAYDKDDEHKFDNQLHQLALMGFTNRDLIMQMLELNGGDVNAVIQAFLQQQQMLQGFSTAGMVDDAGHQHLVEQ
ncbi:hypothetical protein HELRODRAFT_185570 [Helobdella robusta]|uniref:Ubiquilin n=1 Tax=Helobdella robusta TaxID=6412 RepID=T1FMZ6_HELRO|nr:hypothetical protein HELRODRAFT_185570 [Helobdella robusta]ESO04696.1 hypothetical protein HELRODRAFT_185570 [Helobdella robusta]